MLDLIALKIRRSKYTGPIFGDRVAVVADVSRATTYTALAWPAAYVTLSGETVSTQAPGSNSFDQLVTQQYDVIAGLEAINDIRAQEPSLRIEDVRRALFRAIYNWSPNHKRWGALWYQGLERIAVDRAVTYWRLGFGSYVNVSGDCDGETEEQFDPLPDFHGANIKVDWIDPHDPGNPPSQIYDPRRGPAPWPKGPEGRIEQEFHIDYPHVPPIPLPPARKQ